MGVDRLDRGIWRSLARAPGGYVFLFGLLGYSSFASGFESS